MVITVEVLLQFVADSIVTRFELEVRNFVLDRVKSSELASRFLKILIAEHYRTGHRLSFSVAVAQSILSDEDAKRLDQDV